MFNKEFFTTIIIMATIVGIFRNIGGVPSDCDKNELDDIRRAYGEKYYQE